MPSNSTSHLKSSVLPPPRPVWSGLTVPLKVAGDPVHCPASSQSMKFVAISITPPPVARPCHGTTARTAESSCHCVHVAPPSMLPLIVVGSLPFERQIPCAYCQITAACTAGALAIAPDPA